MHKIHTFTVVEYLVEDFFYKSHLEDAGLVLKEEIKLGNDTITKWERN